jgi:predicted Fe-Mo cluster-binding NifX family protein
MKIAVVTEDGQTISQHFGRAPHYQVLTVEDGRIVDREMREKPGHNHFAHEPHEPHAPGTAHGSGPQAESRHARMAEVIADCEAILSGGMGSGAYYSLQARGIRPIVTEIASIDEAIMAYVEGRIVDRLDRLH